MSNIVNDELIELASDHMEFWTGTLWEEIFQADLDKGDLTALHYHLKESAREMAIQDELL